MLSSQLNLSESSKLVDLENSWISTMKPNNQQRRHAQMTQDIKKFSLRSMDKNARRVERKLVARLQNNQNMDIFGKISETFDFIHHEGTDTKAEMKVVKIILVREGQVMTLKYLSDKCNGSGNVAKTCSRILELLSEVRESTLNYLEALCLWRQTIPNGNTMSPRVFFWEKKNYTLKIVNDLDFLADNQLIIEALKLSPEQFRSNPLMLTNNLDDPNTWIDPMERASQDTGGVTQGPVFESRLRLRFAERILLQEIDLYANLPIHGNSNTFLTEPQIQTSYPQSLPPTQQQQQQQYNSNIHSNSKISPTKAMKNQESDLGDWGSQLLQEITSIEDRQPFLQSPSQEWDSVNRERGKGWVDVKYVPMDGTPASGEGGQNSPLGIDKPPINPYLLPPPGYDISLMPTKLPGSSLTSSHSNTRPGSLPIPARSRPDSRGMAAGSMGNKSKQYKNIKTAPPSSRGMSVSQSLDIGTRNRLPPVDKSALTRASLQANGLFSPEVEDDQMAATDRPYTEGAMCSNRPISRSVLLKSGMEVTPYYTEVVTDIYKYPLLIALLASADQRSKLKKHSHLNSLTKPTLATASKSRDEYDYSPSGGSSKSQRNHLQQSSIYEPNNDEEDEYFDRLIIKVFDAIGHSECVIYAPIQEYLLFREELQNKYEGNINPFFQPNTKSWWANNIRYLIRVQLKRNGLLHMTISKKLIEDVVLSAMKKAEETKKNKNYGRRITKIIKRNNINTGSNSNGNNNSNPHSPCSQHSNTSNNSSKYSDKNESPLYNTTISTTTNNIKKAVSRTDSECAVVVASSLEDDYDFDFDN